MSDGSSVSKPREVLVDGLMVGVEVGDTAGKPLGSPLGSIDEAGNELGRRLGAMLLEGEMVGDEDGGSKGENGDVLPETDETDVSSLAHHIFLHSFFSPVNEFHCSEPILFNFFVVTLNHQTLDLRHSK